jgi:membrane protease YdiL (CAAX protease family)
MQPPAAASPAPAPAPPLREDLRLAAWLALAGALATAAVFPYLLETMPQLLDKVPLPLAALIPLQALQAGVILGLLSLLGLRLGHRVGLGAPWLSALLARRTLPEVAWGRSALLGAGTAAVIVGLSLLTDPWLPPPSHPLPDAAAMSAWKGLLASFYGGIGEELQLRLFLMTLLAWVVARLRRRGNIGPGVYWFAIVLAALLFGAGHLPAAAAVWPLTGMVVLRTLLLNAVAGLAFGWVYWRRGLEAAMLAHFCADLVLHVAVPLLARAG